MKIEKVPLGQLTPDPNNAKEHTPKQIAQIKASIERFGNNDPIAVWGKDNLIVEGHGRYEALKALGYKEAEIIRLDRLTDEERRAYALAHNQLTMNTGWLDGILEKNLDAIESIDMADFGFDVADYETQLIDAPPADGTTLVERFGVPPFSVLDTTQGYWQDRKKKWLELGLNPQNGRGDALISDGLNDLVEIIGGKNISGTSVFDPVLCEIMYAWFCPNEGSILDPFAGGAVRGVVAHRLGYKYTGNDLRKEQIDDNYKIGRQLCAGNVPKWTCGDSVKIREIVGGGEYDFLFTCPPYADLEVYSDLPDDISNMPYEDFLKAYRKIIAESVEMLKNDRFAVIVVGDVRDKKGFYRDFLGDTKTAFKECGAHLYNELILKNAIGSAAVRANSIFANGRKVVKTHQNVLVFYKGNPKHIKDNFGRVYVGEIDETA